MPAPSTLRTLQVVNVRWFNATAWYGMELARLLNKAGHPTLTLGLEGTASFARAQAMGLDPIGLPLNTCNPLRTAQLARSIQKIVRDFRPDIVNCHRGEAFWLWGLLKGQAPGYALVRTRGDQRLPRNSLVNRRLHQHTAEAVISTNSVMARHFINELHVPAAQVHTILGGVDTGVFRFSEERRQAVRTAYGYKADDQVVGLLGRFDRVKGQKELIHAVASLRRQGNQRLRLLLIGFTTATTQDEVESWIKDAGIADITRITGKVSDVVGHLCALDVGVIASLWSETIARAALEIMACARPLVSTSVGVMPDLLPAEALCPPADEQALARLLQHALDSQTFRERLVHASSLTMRELDSSHFLQKTLAVYDAALALRRNRNA